MNVIFDLILHLFNSVTAVVYYTGIMKVRSKGKWLNEAGLVISLLVSAGVSHVFRYNPPLRFVSVLTVMFLTAMLFFDAHLIVKVRTTAEYLLLSMTAEVFGVAVAGLLKYEDINTMEFDSPDRAVMSIVLSTLLAGLVPVVILLRNKAKLRQLWRVALVQTAIAVTQISMILLVYFSAESRSENLVYIIAIIQIPGILLELFCARVILALTREVLTEKEQEFRKTKTDMEYDYYRLALENNEKLSMLRHDIGNTIQAAMSLIHNGDISKGNELLGDIYKVSISTAPVTVCDHDIVNIILALKHEEMKKDGIMLKVNIRTELCDMPVSDRELTSVLTNLLDNAREACLGCSGDRRVEVTIGKQQGFYIIKIVNSCNGESVYIPESTAQAVTTKNDSELHGFGLRAIYEICKDYDGNFSIYRENGNVVSVVTFAQE